MKRTLMMLAIGFATIVAVQAEEELKLVAKPSGRILFDAAYLNPQNQEDALKSGVGIPDVRVGVGFTIGQWKGKIDMGYAYGKVGLKDVFLQYNFDKKNFLRGGYFIHQYGYHSCTSSSFKETMEEPQSNSALNNDRMIGLMYEHMDKNFLATVSAVVETDAMKQTTDVTGSEGIGAMTRLLWHPHTERGNIFHVGISGGVEGARYSSDGEKNHKQFTLSSNWPTRVAKVKAQQAEVTEARLCISSLLKSCSQKVVLPQWASTSSTKSHAVTI
jgi:phosphate-selective porin OprO/OprP